MRAAKRRDELLQPRHAPRNSEASAGAVLEDERPRVGPPATSRAKPLAAAGHVTVASLSNLKAPCCLQLFAMAAATLQGSLGTPCAWWKEPCILGALACSTLRRSLANVACV